MTRITIQLKGRYAPGDKDWHQGTLARENANGIEIEDRGERYFYPWGQVTRVDR